MAETTKNTFKKEDFLNAIQLAKKWNYDIETVKQAMISAYKRGTTFLIGSSPRPMVIVNRTKHVSLSSGLGLELHPLAHEKLKALIAKGK